MATLSLLNLTKRFDNAPVVHNVSLEIQSGEFFSILGPSGCGKTTLLRLIAGFESATEGKILLDGRDLTSTPPQFRAIGMVFQNYALFPHMTVFQNVAFGLETQRVPKREIRQRVERILEAVHLLHKIATPVPHLSGGEQQRVAVARALVVEPAVLLFDEPLSNLDVALRTTTREEIRSLQRKTHITTIYVTHDQTEAITLSDRIAVMQSGNIVQVGTPSSMYESPQSPFVAQFLGGANLVPASVNSGQSSVTVESLVIEVPRGFVGSNVGNVSLSIKPEAIVLNPPDRAGSYDATVVEKSYLGFTTDFVIATGGVSLRVTCVSSGETKRLVPGSHVRFHIDWSRCILFPG
jgi:ABC-type Fe3+/spermidine/putrescine transport system ATPase subunit